MGVPKKCAALLQTEIRRKLHSNRQFATKSLRPCQGCSEVIRNNNSCVISAVKKCNFIGSNAIRNSNSCNTSTVRSYSSNTSLLSNINGEYIISSPHSVIEIPDQSFTEFLFSELDSHKNSVVMVDNTTGRTFTSAQLKDYSIRVASALTKLGYRKGDKILIFSNNCAEYSILFMACGELARQLKHSQSSCIVAMSDMLQTVVQAVNSEKEISELVKVIVSIGHADGCLPFSVLMEDDGKAFPENTDINSKEDVVHLPYSSGTTGLPKGVELTHYNLISYMHLVPPVVLFLAKSPLVDKFNVSSIHSIVSAAAPLGEGLTREVIDRLDCNIIQAYGLTESSPVTHYDSVPTRHGTIGQLVPNTIAKVGPQVMKGYLNNQKATDEMVKDGWMFSGDIGHFDEDGYFVISDRLKELIKYKGFQIAPAELEALIYTHPAVQDVAVIGIPGERESGEVPKAFVVPKPNLKLKEEDVIQFIKLLRTNV
ncbi:hypothetical protein KUTeg_022891 [Tegillarca granosa]|uniref:Uncharacterized protein n=1 Tax=Tegillarca granosa TaxID=220873 RepID=A0ABQ9E362_TEGGR|nr:hypothetical protein KUTeg_022891 [Tegillarca granosa]